MLLLMARIRKIQGRVLDDRRKEASRRLRLRSIQLTNPMSKVMSAKTALRDLASKSERGAPSRAKRGL